MAFEYLSINMPKTGAGLNKKPRPPVSLPPLTGRGVANANPVLGGGGPTFFTGGPLPPVSVGGLINDKPVLGGDSTTYNSGVVPPITPTVASSRPQINKPILGGDGPTYNPTVEGTPKPTATPARTKIGQDAFQRAFQAWADNQFKNGGHSIFAGFGDGAMAKAVGGGGSRGGAAKPPVNPKPPVTPPPQWSFKPNAYDQPTYQTPMLNAAAYTNNPPAQPWMFDPATYGAGAPPQWYGQPVVPNSQPPFRY
jgi:hypothetical protein